MSRVTDKIFIKAPIDRVYEYCWNATLWPKITPHVREIEIFDQSAEGHRMRMTVENEGKLYKVESTRTTVPCRRISYKQTTPPAFLSDHSGEWEFSAVDQETCVQLTHHFVAKDTAAAMLGVPDSVDLESYIGERLTRNGLLTLSAIKAALEKEGN